MFPRKSYCQLDKDMQDKSEKFSRWTKNTKKKRIPLTGADPGFFHCRGQTMQLRRFEPKHLLQLERHGFWLTSTRGGGDVNLKMILAAVSFSICLRERESFKIMVVYIWIIVLCWHFSVEIWNWNQVTILYVRIKTWLHQGLVVCSYTDTLLAYEYINSKDKDL